MSQLIRRATSWQDVPIANTAATYSTGNQVVGGLFELPNMVNPGGISLLHDVLGIMSGESGWTNPLVLILFSQKPTGSYANLSTYSPTAADCLKVIFSCSSLMGTISALSTGAGIFSSLAFSMGSAAPRHSPWPLFSKPDPLNNGKDGSVWGLVTTDSASTIFNAANELLLRFAVEQL